MVVRMTYDALLGLPYARLTLVGSLLLTACNSDSKDKALTTDAGQDNTTSSATVGDAALPEPARDAAVGDGGAGALVDGGATTASDAGATSAEAGRADAGAVDAARPDAGGTPVALDSGAPDAGVVVDSGPPDTGVPVVVDAGPPPCSASAAPVIGKLGLQTVVSDGALANLTDAVQPPGSNDWYLVQQNGVIRVFRNGALLPTPFLNLSGEFAFIDGNNFEDRGLLSIAFAPDYATSGLFYVSFTPNQGPQVDVDMLLEFKRSAADAFVADPGSRRTLLATDGTRRGSTLNTDNIHNGGRVTFGPDGKLYLAMGDGGGLFCSQVEPAQSQSVGSLFGKLLRLDLTQSAPYGALDNPFVSDGDPRVWQYGTRNPYRFTFDRATGDLYFADVGQDTFEEVDFAPAGAKGLNFGWNAYEGNSDQTCKEPLRAGSVHTPPIFVLDRSAGATGPFADYNAIIGGIVYRGKSLPSLQGVYLFGANRGARLGALTHCGDTTSPVTPVTKQCNPNTPNEACLRPVDGGPAFEELRAIVEDHDGELYVVANGNSLLKVVPSP